MYILLLAFAFVFVFVLALLLVPIKAVLYKKDEFDFYLKIFCFKIKIKDRHKDKNKKTKKPSGASKKKFPFSVVKKIARLSDDIKDLAEFFSKRCIVVDNIKLRLEFGTGDAAQTGIATGVLNTAVYGFVGIVHQNVRLKKWTVDIIPEFQEEKFELEFLCIGTTRLLHIISIGIKGVKLYRKFSAS